MENIKKDIIRVCRKLHERGLVSAFGGNVSARFDEDKIIITPSGFPLAEISEKDLMIIDINDNIVEGYHKPSSERLMHLAIYKKRSDVKAIVHTHSVIATSFACTGKNIELITPESQIFLKKIPLAPYKPAGTQELAEVVAEVIEDGNAALLENHGVVVFGENVDRAYNLAELVEELAQINLYVKIIRG